MNSASKPSAPKRSLLREDRTLHLLDVENLCGTPAFTEDDLIEVQRRYSALIPIGPSDLVVLAASHYRARELLFGWTNARHLLRSGPDGADLRLLEVINNENVGARFSHVVIGSGDGIFQPACEFLQAQGAEVTIVSGKLRSIARSLRLSVNEIRSIGHPAASHPGPSRRITVAPLKRPRRFPDRPDPRPRRGPAAPPAEPAREPARR